MHFRELILTPIIKIGFKILQDQYEIQHFTPSAFQALEKAFMAEFVPDTNAQDDLPTRYQGTEPFR
jgi:hypothetical protein